jgi:DNA-directed RNA polymerase specialized sigma24 family protein
MTGDLEKAKEAFQGTVREAALRASRGEPPADRLWFFREARGRCLAAAEQGLQPEDFEIEHHEVCASAPAQIAQLDSEQLAVWVSSAPDPQRSALSLFYLDEFSDSELLSMLELKPRELSKLLVFGRHQFQAWLDAVVPHYEE